MRILLDWKKPETEINYLIGELQKEHDVVYHVGFSTDEAKGVSKAIFHDVAKAIKVLPAKAHEGERFDPPSAELIEKMYPVESVVLTMMNRKFGKKSVDERKHVYYHMLEYWDFVLKKYKPDVIIFNAIPHATYNYVLYGLANIFNIKTLMFVDTYVPDQMLPIIDYKKLNPEFKEALERNKTKNYNVEDLGEALRSYYNLHAISKNDKVDKTPNYIKQQRRSSSVKAILISKLKGALESIKNKTFLINVRKNIHSFIFKSPKEIGEREYRKMAESPDLNIPFVYFGLHYQPERTTSPQGEMFVDQILATEMISKALPEGWKIYVKEHPLQWFLRDSNDPDRYRSVRYGSYYKRLSNIKNVVLLKPEVSSYELMDKAKAVVSITGKVGMEGSLRGKPVLLFGYPWYRFFRELLIVGSVGDCKIAFNKILSGWLPSKDALINFLKTTDEIVFNGYSDTFGEINSKIKPEDNIKTLSARILKELSVIDSKK